MRNLYNNSKGFHLGAGLFLLIWMYILENKYNYSVWGIVMGLLGIFYIFLAYNKKEKGEEK